MPSRFFLNITVPVVDYDKEDHNWNKWLAVLQCFTMPVFITIATKGLSDKNVFTLTCMRSSAIGQFATSWYTFCRNFQCSWKQGMDNLCKGRFERKQVMRKEFSSNSSEVFLWKRVTSLCYHFAFEIYFCRVQSQQFLTKIFLFRTRCCS